MFRKADLVLLTKIDLLPHLPSVDLDAVLDGIAQVMPANEFIRFSAVTGEGVAEWIAWVAAQRAARLASAVSGHAHGQHPHHHRHVFWPLGLEW